MTTPPLDALPLEPLPLDTRFTLGPSITDEQRAFLQTHGFLHFEQVLTADEVALIRSELDRIEAEWLAEDRRFINGIPLFFGQREDGQRFIQRFAFTSLFSSAISRLIQDQRFEPLRALIGDDIRVGETEKDGVVVNRFLNERGSIYKRLGWHTDGLRDLFYLRMPGPMLNVGLHLDPIDESLGGLRLIPGTHDQGFWSMCFRKLYFLQHGADPAEICVRTQAGDLTVHDGRLWHRVAQATNTGPQTLRHSIYVPYINGPVEPKDEDSRTPAYHHIGRMMRAVRSRIL